jgi:hypothetical protein
MSTPPRIEDIYFGNIAESIEPKDSFQYLGRRRNIKKKK